MLEAGSAIAGTGLSGKIIEKLRIVYGKKLDVKASAEGWDALSEAIIEYFTTNAEISVPNTTAGGDTASGTLS